jgi:glycosyltransferase involved in cell wall biosynthesis
MNIIYVVHESYKNEISGAPILTKNYAEAAIKAGHQISILSATNKNINNKLNVVFEDNIFFLNWPSLNSWNENTFINYSNLKYTGDYELPFKPDIIHVMDWVNINPNFLEFFKKLDVPIIRTILNFEDLCYFVSPIYYEQDYKPCAAPLTAERCSNCISENIYNKKKILSKLKDNILGLKKKKFNFYKQNLRNRNNEITNLTKKYFEHLIFPTETFAKFYLSHLNIDIKYSIIDLGIKKNYQKKNLEISNEKLNFIFLGGAEIRKGWNIIEETFYKILSKYKDRVNLKVYGHKKKTSKSKLKKFKSVNFYESFNNDKMYDILSWADLGLIPSYFEVYNLALREYIEAGLIPIVTNFFGSEIVKNNINGIILKYPYVDDLYKTVEELLNNKNLFSDLKKNVRKTQILYINEQFNIVNKLYKNLVI